MKKDGKIEERRYCQLQQQLLNLYEVENGNLIPLDQVIIDTVKKEMTKLEEQYPDLNFMQDL